MKKHRLNTSVTSFAAVLALSLLTACAGISDHGKRIDVYKHDGSRQCEGPGLTPQEMQRELEGIRVYAAVKKQREDVMFPAVCGGMTPNINVYTIDANKRYQAQQRGFAVWQSK